jgi:hypothetical protein
MSYQPHPDPQVELVRQAMACAVANMAAEPERFAAAAEAQPGSVIAELDIFQDLAVQFYKNWPSIP